MLWFQQIAPIRLKLLIAFGFMTALVGLSSVIALYAPPFAGMEIPLVLTAIAGLTGLWFRHIIATPYVTTVERMEGLAAGDLASSIHHTGYRDCVGRLTKAMFAFRDTAVAQQALIDAVMRSAATMEGESGEIARVAATLSRRVESNAASLEETTAAVTQIDARLKVTAVAASRTVERANQTIATVGGGRAVADEAVAAMGRVSDSATGIDSVIEGLDKIAFQTRVLAMNAAVEAGRAGQAGRGFAVVADLVSALAMRAEEESKRARDQLTLSHADIITAVGAVRKVDGALADIAGDVGQVHELLATMATDNHAQSVAITEISCAIDEMNRATQQNAAMVEETSGAARKLAVEISTLARRASSAQADPLRIDLADVKPLPPAAIAALTRPQEAWQAF